MTGLTVVDLRLFSDSLQPLTSCQERKVSNGGGWNTPGLTSDIVKLDFRLRTNGLYFNNVILFVSPNFLPSIR